MAPLRRSLARFTVPVLLVAASLGLAVSTAATATTTAGASAAPSYAAQTSQARTASSTAAAAPGYVYWGYYSWNDQKDTWDYATVGANDRSKLPQDGDVLGFRWALVVKKPRLPRADGDFAAICAGKQASDGQKRVAFVVDYGSPSDAVGSDETPQAQGVCTVVDDSFTAQQALQTALPVRPGKSGIICAINDYPSTGCGSEVKNPTEPPSDKSVNLLLPGDKPAGAGTTQADSRSQDDGSSVALPIVVTAVVVMLLVAGALVLRRRQT